MPVAESVQRPELVRTLGTDGAEYVIRPAEFTLVDLERLWERMHKLKMGLDDVPTWDLFLLWVQAARPVWFEAIRVSDGMEVGLIYLSDFLPMWVGGPGYVQARFHALAWDSDAATRMPVLQALIPELFRLFRLHRLEAQVPLNKGGTIRVAKKLGFKEEGVLREVRRYHGQWWSVLVLSLLDREVNSHGARPSKTTDT